MLAHASVIKRMNIVGIMRFTRTRSTSGVAIGAPHVGVFRTGKMAFPCLEEGGVMSDMSPVPVHHHDPRRGEGTSWIVGVVLIVLGSVFMLERSGYAILTGNWWALFIYVAAAASLLNAWRSQRSAGRFGPAAITTLVWGLVLAVVATILFFNLAWDVWWPGIMVAVGIGIVTGYLLGDRPES